MQVEKVLSHRIIHLIITISLPVLGSGIGLLILPNQPVNQWVLLLPALFVSAWLTGRWGGLVSTLLALGLAAYQLIPLQLPDDQLYFQLAMLAVMGAMFSGLLPRPNLQQDILKRQHELDAVMQQQRNSENLTRSIMDSLDSSIAVLDEHGNILRINKAWMQFATEYDGTPSLHGEVCQNYFETCQQARDTPDAQAVLTAMQAILAGELPSFTIEYRCLSTTGQRWFRLDILPLLGATRGLVTHHIDISQRKLIEEQLSLRSRALEAAANGIMISNADGAIEWVNPAFSQLTGYDAAEVLGAKPQALFKTATLNEQFYAAQWQVIASGAVWQGEIMNRRKDGSEYPEENIITPVWDENGIIKHYIAFKQNISIRKQNQAELERYRDQLEQLVSERTNQLSEAREEAEHLSQVKSQFLANMSHELRTPLHGLLGFCYLLEHLPLASDAKNLVAKIQSAGQALLAIINDILDFSKIEAGRLSLEAVPFILSDVVEDLANMMAHAANQKQIQLLVTPIVAEQALLGDKMRIQQVLLNLLSNAIKFTEQGEIELEITQLSASASQIALRFLVRDTGIGIAAAQQLEIFSPFTQADNTISRRFGGSGLGLAISYELVKLMGGELQVSSQVGVGSEFSFSLNLHRDTLNQPACATIPPFKVLIFDQSHAAAQALQNTVKFWGWQVKVIEQSPTVWLAAGITGNDDQHYDAIFMDWESCKTERLAWVDGFKQHFSTLFPARKPPLLLMVVSAYARQDLADNTAMALFDAVLCKPITPKLIYQTLTNLLIELQKPAETVPSTQQTPVRQRLTGLTVLVVDDSEINREVALAILQTEGAKIFTANDGQQALDWLFAHPDEVDIILMDLHMPNLDGYATARIIRQHSRWQNLPIIALTAGAFQSLQDDILAAGMNDFLAKPFQVEQLCDIIASITQNCLIQVEQARQPRQTVSHAPAESGLMPILQVLAADKAIKQWGNAALYGEFLQKFMVEYQHTVIQLTTLIEQQDRAKAKFLAHKLKGVAGNMGLEKLAEASDRLERQLLDSEPVQAELEQLEQVLAASCAQIKVWLQNFTAAGTA